MVQIKKGTGDVTINGKNVINYFTHPFYRRTALRVIELGFLSCLIDVEM
jgi:ribosomal protein S9